MRDDILGDKALRLGFRQIKGCARPTWTGSSPGAARGYDSVRDLWLRAELSVAALEDLAEADAFRSIGLDRRDALWAVRGLNRAGDKDDLPLFAREPAHGPRARRRPAADAARRACGRGLPPPVPVAQGPSGVLRAGRAARAGASCRARLWRKAGDGRRVTVAGLVLVRQRPGSANGTIFLTIEDETGVANVIVWPKIFERARAQVIAARFLAVTGKLQHESGVTHIVAERFDDLTPMLTTLSSRGAEIQDLARADEVKQPQTFDTKERGHGADLGLKLGFPLAADTRTPRGEPAAGPQRPRRTSRDALPKGRNFH